MPAAYDVAAVGNAIVDVISPADDAFLAAEGLSKGAMKHLVGQRETPPLASQASAGVQLILARSLTTCSVRYFIMISPPRGSPSNPVPYRLAQVREPALA